MSGDASLPYSSFYKIPLVISCFLQWLKFISTLSCSNKKNQAEVFVVVLQFRDIWLERIDIVTFVPSFLSKSLSFYLFISSFRPEFCNSVFTIPILSLWNLAQGDLVPGVCFFFLLKSILTLYSSFIFRILSLYIDVYFSTGIQWHLVLTSC